MQSTEGHTMRDEMTDRATLKGWEILSALKERQELPYWVTFKHTGANGVTTTETERFATELDAVRWISDVEFYDNTEPVAYSDNINRGKYRN
ncbi:hypothetical protein ACFQ8S_06755 [Streptomyces virginiae]|uniref:hypothetical protein n=1 Tax=Streptomyces virginiae TaxID=1961 RepID=UPI00369CA117